LYHLNTRDVGRRLNISVDGKTIEFDPNPTYLGVKLDRSLTFRPHLTSVRQKFLSRCALLNRLASTGWGASVSTLRTSSLALVYPTAEYCSQAWSRSRSTKEVDVAINSALRTITGCLKPTPTQYLPIPEGIAPASVRRNAPTLRLALKYALTEHFNDNLVRLKTRPRLKSRRSFAQSAIELMESLAGHESIAQWTVPRGVEEVRGPPKSLPPSKVGNPDLGLRRSAWCKLNHLRTRVGRSGNHYTDGRWHRILGVHAVLEKPKPQNIS